MSADSQPMNGQDGAEEPASAGAARLDVERAAEPSESLKTANDLLAIFGACSSVEVEGRQVLIKPLRIGELPGFLQWYDLWRGKGDGPEARDRVRAEAEVRVVEILTGEDRGWLYSLSDADLDRVVGTAFAANPTLFASNEKAEVVPGQMWTEPPRKRKEGSLLVSIALLVEAGHSLSDIKDYTLQQVDILSRCHSKIAADRQINAMAAARSGQIDGKKFGEIVKDIETVASRFLEGER
ncbi:MAG: hypothetical protein C0607_14900 [Azoarcus sp.]|nr:MAG: hypothetical protein C0607_14900 [Azoarcus sp.]